MAEQERAVDYEPALDIIITPTIERDYRRRNVFLELWSDGANKVLPNGAFVHEAVCLELAREVLVDAKKQRWDSDGPRGTGIAYAALDRKLRIDIKVEELRGAVPDPGIDEIRNPWAECPARFQPGEAAMLWMPGGEHHRRLVEIVDGYCLMEAGAKNGRYFDEKGERLDYYHGYTAKLPGGVTYAYAAHYLRAPDGTVRHLQLVHSE